MFLFTIKKLKDLFTPNPQHRPCPTKLAVDPTSTQKQHLLKTFALDIHLRLLKSAHTLCSKLRIRHAVTAAIF